MQVESQKDMNIIRDVFDAHFHIGAYGKRKSAGKSVQPIIESLDHKEPSDCTSYLDKKGLKGGLIVPTYFDDQSIAFNYNSLVVEATKLDSRLLGGLYVCPLPDWMKESEKAMTLLPSKNIRALKMAPNKWPSYSINPDSWDTALSSNMDKLMGMAADLDLMVHFHSGYAFGADPADFDGLVRRFGRKTKIQIVHMGEAVKPAFKFVPRFIEWLSEGFRVYTDTSIVPGFAPIWLLDELDKHGLGHDRIMFATDSPWGLFESEYWKIEGLPVNDDIKDDIFFANARRIFDL